MVEKLVELVYKEYSVLEYIRKTNEESNQRAVTLTAVQEALEMTKEKTQSTLQSLKEKGLVDAYPIGIISAFAINSRGLRALRKYKSDFEGDATQKFGKAIWAGLTGKSLGQMDKTVRRV